jgi:hypothetical protein
MIMRCLLASLVIIGAIAADSDAAVQITVYNDNLALVKDSRDLDYQKGTFDLSFTDVASAIDPTSVAFSTLDSPSAVTLLEQNFRYDLVSSEKVLSKYVDKSIRAITKQDKVHEGVLLAVDTDALTLKQADGGLVMISRPEIADLSFPSLPEGLITRPTLVWKLDSQVDGKHASEVRYLTGGIGWNAQYVGVVNPSEDGLSLSGWVSIDNHSGATYDEAQIKLVAGDVNRVRPAPRPNMMAMESMAKSAAGFAERQFFEYHLYQLQRPSTIRDNETKQLALFDPTQVKATKVFTYNGAYGDNDVAVSMEFVNSSAAGLGMPLPKGVVRMMKADTDGSLEFVGEDQIDHTPKDEKVRVRMGNAFDLVGERRQVNFQQVSNQVTQESYEIKLRNHKKDGVTILVSEPQSGDWEITESSHPYTKKDAHTAEWNLLVPADSETVLTYTVKRGS